MALYPLSAFRAMNKAALRVYEALRRDGTQQRGGRLDADPRGALRVIGYHEFERKLDELFAQSPCKPSPAATPK